jgi:GNAT superfamily N-acetyltransferase
MAADVAVRTRILLAAWDDAMLVGTVMLESRHRRISRIAPSAKLLVHPASRRRGVARALMVRAQLRRCAWDVRC